MGQFDIQHDHLDDSERRPVRDDDAVMRAREGDQAAWGQLYAANANRLVAWLRVLPTGDAASDCEDVAAEAWLVAAQRIHEFKGTSSDFAGWLFGIARNLAWNQRRRSTRRGTSPYAVDPGDLSIWGTSDDSADEQALSLDLTSRLLACLSTREAEVVACCDVVGLDVKSVSVALGISPTAVRVAHHRALGKLRRLFPTSEALVSSREPSISGTAARLANVSPHDPL